MATTESSAPNAHPSTEEPPRHDQDEPPHACTEGVVYLTYVVFDEEIGGEVERLEGVPCRRCAEETR